MDADNAGEHTYPANVPHLTEDSGEGREQDNPVLTRMSSTTGLCSDTGSTPR